MKRTAILLLTWLAVGTAHADAMDKLLQGYRAQGAGPFLAIDGAALWTRAGGAQTCADCHGEDLSAGGKHARTGKPIEPMAPSVNPKRLTNATFIEKWFKRNCESAWGRTCTAQEKGDFLAYISTQ
jgi:mono/diheme cytochrome c family protein